MKTKLLSFILIITSTLCFSQQDDILFSDRILEYIDNGDFISLNIELCRTDKTEIFLGQDRIPALIYALLNSRLACAEILIEHNAGINDTFFINTGYESFITSPIQLAVYNKYNRIILNLIYHGADINVKGSIYEYENEISVLDLACEKEILDLFRGTPDYDIFIQNRADFVNAILLNDMAGVKKYIEEGGHADFDIEPYIEPGWVDNASGTLSLAMEKADIEICKMILETEFNRRDMNFDYYYFKQAIYAANEELLEYLFETYNPRNISEWDLFSAIYTKNINIVNMLLDQFDDISGFYGINGQSVIRIALRQLNPEIVWAVIQKYNQENDTKDVLEIIYENNIEELRELIISGLDPDLMFNGNLSLLTWASFLGNTEIVKLLLESGANPSGAYIYNGYEPVWHAVKRGNRECVNLLVEYGANLSIYEEVYIFEEEPASLVDYALVTLGNETAQLLIESGADFIYELIGYGLYSHAENIAVKNNNMDFLIYLLEKVERKFALCIVPLESAVRHSRFEVIEYFIEQGYDFNHYYRLLELAVRNDNTEMFIYLMSHPEYHNSPGFSKLTDLAVYSIMHNNLEILDYLFSAGLKSADNPENELLRNTELYYTASRYGNPETINYLSDCGISPEITFEDGDDPCYRAVIYNNLDVLETLINSETDINRIFNYSDYDFDGDISYFYDYNFGYDNREFIEDNSTLIDAAGSFDVYSFLRKKGAANYWVYYFNLCFSKFK